MSILLDIAIQFHEKVTATDEDPLVFHDMLSSLTPDDRQLYLDEFDLYNELSNTAPPSIENIEKFDAQIEEAMER